MTAQTSKFLADFSLTHTGWSLAHRSLTFTDLTWLLPVGAVGDVEEDFEDLCDPLRRFQRYGWCRGVQHTLILVLPLHLQAALQGCSKDGQASLLKEENKKRQGKKEYSLGD